MTRAHATKLDSSTRQIGCPCGHLEAQECLVHAPIPVIETNPCDGRCRTYGLEQITHLSRRYGCCPCNPQAAAS